MSEHTISNIAQFQISGTTKEQLAIDYGTLRPDWKNPPSLLQLKRDLREAQNQQQPHAERISNWLDALRVTGKHRQRARPNRSNVHPRVIRKQNEWRYSSLCEPFLSTDKLFAGKAVTWEDGQAARQNEIVLNHQFTNQINRVKFIDEYVRTAVDEGTVILKVGWEYEDENYEEEVPVFDFIPDPAFGETLQEVQMLAEANPNEYERTVPEELKRALEIAMQTGEPVRPVDTGQTEVVQNVRILKNQPTVEICDYRNVYFDPTCNGDATKAQFVFHSYESDIATLKADGRYANLDKINMNTGGIMADENHESDEGSANFTFADTARSKFVVQSYWGLFDISGENTLEPILLEWVGDVIIRAELTPMPDRQHPFVVATLMPKKRSIYGECDAELLQENQAIIGAVTRGMIDVLGRSANAQTGMKMGMLDGVNKRRYQRGDDYEFAPNMDPRTGIHMHTFNDISPSAQFMLQQQQHEAESLTGVKAFYGGLSGDSLGDVATSVKGMLDSAARRELNILRRLADGIIQIGKKFAAMNGVFLSEVEVVRLTNEEFVEVRRDELNGQFDLELTISSAEEDNVKAQEIAYMVQTMGNNVDFSFTKMMLAEIFRLRKLPALAKNIEEYEPQPNPFEEQMQELQLQKLQKEIQLLESQIAENMAEAGLDAAKAATEQARVANIEASTDKLALDFLEQESGAKQERDIQRQQAQAHGNIELEKTKQQQRREEAAETHARQQENQLLQAYLDRQNAARSPKSS